MVLMFHMVVFLKLACGNIKSCLNVTWSIRQFARTFIMTRTQTFFFFFSSKRRHTRYWRDWSSDVCSFRSPRDVVVCAAGSMPGDLHKMWRVRDPKGYHVEYGYSCMGYEIPGGIGIRMASPDRDVFVMIGDGSYLMMPTELVTAVQEGVKIVVVLVQNHGFASIGALSEQLGSQRFGTRYRARAGNGRLEGGLLPVDLAANAASLGVDVLTAHDGPDLEAALRKAKASDRPTVVHVETDPLVDAPPSESWWDVRVSEVSTRDSTQRARAVYEQWKARQHPYLTPSERGSAQS